MTNEEMSAYKTRAKEYAKDKGGEDNNIFKRMSAAKYFTDGIVAAWTWTEVDKQPPPNNTWVLTWNDDPHYQSMNFLLYRNGEFRGNDGHIYVKPTHWKPTPPTPKQIATFAISQ